MEGRGASAHHGAWHTTGMMTVISPLRTPPLLYHLSRLHPVFPMTCRYEAVVGVAVLGLHVCTVFLWIWEILKIAFS